MSKIYLDSYFSELLFGSDHTAIRNYCQFNSTNWLQTLPNDCDIVGISFYTNRYSEYIDLIQQILPRTQRLVVNLSEPTHSDLLKFVNDLEHPKIVFYSDIVVNESTNVKTNISWFIGPTNHYQKQNWAKEILNRIRIPRSWEPRPYVYDCLLGTQKPNRDIIKQLYDDCSFKNKFIFSYYKNNLEHGLWDHDEDFLHQVSEWQSITVSRYAVLPYKIYNQSYLSIVAETTADNRYSQFTEKIAKPILARRPFIVFCGQHYLRNLRQLGFKTFGDVVDQDGNLVIDESYDTIYLNQHRWTAAWNQVKKLHDRNFDLVHAQLQHILDHNLNHFLTTNWQAGITKEFFPD